MPDLKCEINVKNIDTVQTLVDLLVANFDELPEPVKVGLGSLADLDTPNNANDWIDINDGLPAFHVKILFRTSCGQVRIGAWYAKNHKFKSGEDAFYKTDVTHWQPLPWPPALPTK